MFGLGTWFGSARFGGTRFGGTRFGGTRLRYGQGLPSPLSLATIVGSVIAYPTEAVWGLGCLGDDYLAVKKLLRLKNRPWHKGLILVSGHVRHFERYLNGLSPLQRQMLMDAWPGARTFLVPLDQPTVVPSWLRGQHHQIALRVSCHPVIKAITAVLDKPIVSTSANPSGFLPARSARQVRRYFGRDIDLIIEGRLGGLQQPTPIINLVDQTTIRA